MKPLSERDENHSPLHERLVHSLLVGMKPLSERDENPYLHIFFLFLFFEVGMKPLSERDENPWRSFNISYFSMVCRNEATL